MTHKGTQTFQTERLILRKFTINDSQNMYDNWASNPNVTRYMTWGVHDSVETTQGLLNEWVKCYDKDNFYQY